MCTRCEEIAQQQFADLPDEHDYTPVACSNGIHGFLRYEDAKKKYYL